MSQSFRLAPRKTIAIAAFAGLCACGPAPPSSTQNSPADTAPIVAPGPSASPAAASASECAATVERKLAFVSAEGDTVTIAASGPCAAVIFNYSVAVPALGVVWRDAIPRASLDMADADPDGATPSEAEIKTALASFVERVRVGAADQILPVWPAGAAKLSDAGSASMQDTALAREEYEDIRARKIPTLCYASGVEEQKCIAVEQGERAALHVATLGS